MKKGFSLKYKILLLLTLIPLFSLILFLVMAVKEFKEDKIAYVYETNASFAKALASQVGTELASILQSFRPLIQEFIDEKKIGPVGQKFFETTPIIETIIVIQRDISVNGPFQTLVKLSRTEMSEDDLKKFYGDWQKVIYRASSAKRAVSVDPAEEKFMIAEKLISPDPKNETLLLALIRPQDLINTFKTPGSSLTFLMNSEGGHLLKPQGMEAGFIDQFGELSFLKSADDKKLSSGTENLRNDSGDNFLVSFSKVAFGDLFIVSIVDESKALKAVEVLFRKSGFFLIIILSATVIISLLATKQVTSSLLELNTATGQVAGGKFDILVPVKSNDEVGQLAESFNAMANEVARLMMETAEKARMESELKTAQTVQETLFPPSQAIIGDLSIRGFYEPASECGGDWWHYSEVDSKVYLWIGDATGHGAPAALITSAAKSAATIIERLDVEPGLALALLNRAIYDVSKGQIMMTFFLACYDNQTKKLSYANASHEAPFLILGSNKGEQLKKKHLVPMNEIVNPRLGQSRETEYEQHEIDLAKGDRILFYTDGIPDIQNRQGKAWGEREFIKTILKSNQDMPPVSSTVDQMVEEFSAYREKSDLIDDITFFMCERLG